MHAYQAKLGPFLKPKQNDSILILEAEIGFNNNPEKKETSI